MVEAYAVDEVGHVFVVAELYGGGVFKGKKGRGMLAAYFEQPVFDSARGLFVALMPTIVGPFCKQGHVGNAQQKQSWELRR